MVAARLQRRLAAGDTVRDSEDPYNVTKKASELFKTRVSRNRLSGLALLRGLLVRSH